MARVARDRVVICDNTFTSEAAEEADRLRDPSHVRNYGVAEWRSFFELAGLEVADEAIDGARHRLRGLARPHRDAGRTTARASASCSTAASTTAASTLPTVVLKGVKAA